MLAGKSVQNSTGNNSCIGNIVNHHAANKKQNGTGGVIESYILLKGESPIVPNLTEQHGIGGLEAIFPHQIAGLGSASGNLVSWTLDTKGGVSVGLLQRGE